MDSNFEEAFYEVSEILKILPKEITDKIPEKFIQVIEQNKSKTYTKEINGLDNLQDLKKETIAILGLIYRDFLCDKETRKELLIEEQKEKLLSQIRAFKNDKMKHLIIIICLRKMIVLK